MEKEKEASGKKNLVKNYLVKQKYGANRNNKPPWKDPNPVKYGGKYGMMTLKE